MPILTLCNHKGGTGKTTTAIHLAAALGLSGHKTLVIDLDPQSYLTDMLNLNQNIKDENTSIALFGLVENITPQLILQTSHFDLIPSSRALTKVQKNLIQPTDVLWLKEVIRKNTDYEWILLDTAAAITPLTINALVTSDYVVIPMVPEFQSYIGAQQTSHTCRLVKAKLNPDLHDPFILLTKVVSNKVVHKKFQQAMRNQLGNQVLKSIIRTDTALTDKDEFGKTVFEKKGTQRSAIDYANIVDELLNRIEKDNS